MGRASAAWRRPSTTRSTRSVATILAMLTAALLAAQGPKCVDAGKESCFIHPGLHGVTIPIRITEKCSENLLWTANIANPLTRNHVCSGALMEPDLVATTATCLAQFVNGTLPKVIIGAYDVNGKGGDNPEILDTEKVVVHPRFHGDAENGPDLALLQLSQKSAHSPIGACSSMVGCGPGELNFVGWFISQWGGAPEATLSCVPTMKPVDQGECGEVLKGLYEGSVCATAVGTANPVFDYGGPLLCGDNKLVGLASKTELIGGKYYPTSFVEIAKFKKWIDSRGEGESKDEL